MYLSGKEIMNLAEYAGFTVLPLGELDQDILEQEFSIDECPESGVFDDDLKNAKHYAHVVTCDGCENNECSPLGDEINK